MRYGDAIHHRGFQFGLLALSIVALTITAPKAANAFTALIPAVLSASGFADAADERTQPEEDLDLAGALPGDTVAPFIISTTNPAERARAVHCLSEAVYYEAGVEELPGKRAVAQVVLNRVRDKNFPDTVCGVVYQGWWRRTGCQFSFVCDGSLTRRPPGEEEWAIARAIATQALDGYVAIEVGAATHYHTDYVSPAWGPTLVEVAKVGCHIFYKWPGKAGQIAALNQPYIASEVAYWEAASKRSPRKFKTVGPV